MAKVPFETGITHYDEPPPAVLDDLEALRLADRFRFANELRCWAEFEDGVAVRYGRSGGGRMGVTNVRMGGRTLTFTAFQLPDIVAEPEVGDGWVRFRQTVGGRTGLPAPRRVAKAPFVQWEAPLVWATLTATIHADGRCEHRLVGASPFPRHWVYGPDGVMIAKTGLMDFKGWYRRAFGRHSPWGDVDSPALVTAVETALERQLSATIMRRRRPRPQARRGQDAGQPGRARRCAVPRPRRRAGRRGGRVTGGARGARGGRGRAGAAGGWRANLDAAGRQPCHRGGRRRPRHRPRDAGRAVLGPSSRGALEAALEGVALRRVGAVEAPVEPLLALLGGAVGPGLGVDLHAGLLLDAVVADGGRRGQALLDVAPLEADVAALAAPLVDRLRPDPGVAVGLQLEPHRPLVGLLLRPGGLLAGVDRVAGALEVLHVVAELVGDHVRLGEVAGGVEPGGQLAVEVEVDVHLAVGRAVEGPTAEVALPQAVATWPVNRLRRA